MKKKRLTKRFRKMTKGKDPVIKQIKEIFIAEQGRYYLQQEEGSYKCVHRKLTSTLINSHLEKKITLGILPNPTSTKWICFDVDSKKFDIVDSIISTLKHHGIKGGIERSGRKGYHVWIFFKGVIENFMAIKFAEFIIKEGNLSKKQRSCIEIFPSEDIIRNVGKGIKLPWGIHRKTGKETYFLSNRRRKRLDFDEWYKRVKRIEPQLIRNILDENGIELEASYKLKKQKLRRPKEIKPCVKKYIKEGVPEGKRSRIAFIIATEYRETGIGRDKTIDYIIEWNKKNKDQSHPYTKEEIINTVSSAFGSNKHLTYGCNNPDLENNCVGHNICNYLRRFREMNPSKGRGFNKDMFYYLGWQKKLNGSQAHMYTSVLPLLEGKKKRAPGEWVYTKYQELSFHLGKANSTVNDVLVALEKKGLIEWERGKRGKNHEPTKIRRVVPIPKPKFN